MRQPQAHRTLLGGRNNVVHLVLGYGSDNVTLRRLANDQISKWLYMRPALFAVRSLRVHWKGREETLRTLKHIIGPHAGHPVESAGLCRPILLPMWHRSLKKV